MAKVFLRVLRLALISSFLVCFASAAEPVPITQAEFTWLANELSRKVPLFNSIWSNDVTAEFYGGTVRDYLYWIRRKLAPAKDRESALVIAAELQSLKTIPTHEFLSPDSDVDVLTGFSKVEIDPKKFGVSRIDVRSKNRLWPTTEEGRTERDQGYLPIEKIRLTFHGLELAEGLGDGIREIHQGIPTAVFTSPEVFSTTAYAASGRNHRALLAFRYLRALSMEALARYDQRALTETELKQLGSTQSRDMVKKILDDAGNDKQFKELLKNTYFQKKLNETIHKGFGSFTNPTATLALIHATNANKLIEQHERIQPINQYLFSKPHNETTIARNMRSFDVKPNDFFQSTSRFFSNGYVYHGTATEESFQKILTIGILPSRAGMAGEGLYVTSSTNLSTPANYGGNEDRIVKFPISETARLVDVTSGPGLDIFKTFQEKTGGDIEAFAEAFGIDIIKYNFPHGDAFVVKNAAVLGRPAGHTRQFVTPDELERLADAVTDSKSATVFFRALRDSKTSPEAHSQLLGRIKYLRELAESNLPQDIRLVRHLFDEARLLEGQILAFFEKHNPSLNRSLIELIREKLPKEMSQKFVEQIAKTLLPLYLINKSEEANWDKIKPATLKTLSRVIWDLEYHPDLLKLNRRERETVKLNIVTLLGDLFPGSATNHGINVLFQEFQSRENKVRKEFKELASSSFPIFKRLALPAVTTAVLVPFFWKALQGAMPADQMMISHFIMAATAGATGFNFLDGGFFGWGEERRQLLKNSLGLEIEPYLRSVRKDGPSQKSLDWFEKLIRSRIESKRTRKPASVAPSSPKGWSCPLVYKTVVLPTGIVTGGWLSLLIASGIVTIDRSKNGFSERDDFPEVLGSSGDFYIIPLDSLHLDQKDSSKPVLFSRGSSKAKSGSQNTSSKVELSFDPSDESKILVYTKDGRFNGTLEIKEKNILLKGITEGSQRPLEIIVGTVNPDGTILRSTNFDWSTKIKLSRGNSKEPDAPSQTQNLLIVREKTN